MKFIKVISLVLAILVFGCCFAACNNGNVNTPDEPDEPDTPDTPDEPDTPDTPDTPDEPEPPSVEVDFSERKYDDISSIKDKINILGRCVIDDNGFLDAHWSYSGFEFAGWFRSDIVVHYASRNNGSLMVVIDQDYENALYYNVNIDATSFKLPRLSKGYHTVSIYRCNDARYAPIKFKGISYNGMLDEERMPHSIKIEFIGDSISCGTGVISPNGINDDAYYSYPAMLSRRLNAEISVVAVPGWSLSGPIASGANTLIPRIYEMTAERMGVTTPWDFENNQVDCVVINLGTNDYTAYHAISDRVKLREDMSAFLDKVRSLYPNAHIYWTYGMMGGPFANDFKRVINEKSDPMMEFVDVFASQRGIGGHPDVEAHEEYADIFEELIASHFATEIKNINIDKYYAEKRAVVIK